MRKISLICVLSFWLQISFVWAAPVIVIPGDQGSNTFLGVENALTEKISLTVGAVDVFLSEPLPEGWLACNGGVVQAADYPKLVEYLAGSAATSATLPDFRGEFLRGWDHSRGVDPGRALMSVQNGQMLSHTHTATAASAGSHIHTGSTDPAGSHTHIINRVCPPNYSGSYFGSGGGFGRKVTSASTQAAGAHTHSGSLATAGSHTHTATLSASGGAEFRPRNLSVIFAIRAE
jgi:microcystin-dependent protein